jgi:hypothetical protein
MAKSVLGMMQLLNQRRFLAGIGIKARFCEWFGSGFWGLQAVDRVKNFQAMDGDFPRGVDSQPDDAALDFHDRQHNIVADADYFVFKP